MSLPRSTIAGVLLAFVFASLAGSQSLSTVQGFVTDDTGAALAGVTIELADLERGQSRTAATNSRGFFAVRALPSGEYCAPRS